MKIKSILRWLYTRSWIIMSQLLITCNSNIDNNNFKSTRETHRGSRSSHNFWSKKKFSPGTINVSVIASDTPEDCSFYWRKYSVKITVHEPGSQAAG